MKKTIWFKFFISILSLSLILVIAGINLESRIINLKDVQLVKIKDAESLIIKVKNLEIHVIQIQQWLTDISATRAATGFDDGHKMALENLESANVIVEELKVDKRFNSESIIDFQKTLKDFYNTGKKMSDLYISKGPEGGNAFMHEFDTVSEKLQGKLSEITKIVLNENNITFESVRNELGNLDNLLIVIFIFLVIIVAVSLLLTGRALSKSISLNTDLLTVSSNSLLSFSNVLKEKSSVLDETITSQASAIQQAVSSADEINSMLARTQDATVKSVKVSEGSTANAVKGRERIGEMIETIKDIETTNDEVMGEITDNNTEISRITSMISAIGEKTKVINDIVFQTKLLSFNASVEAARAGEHGKGFSVVAEEVGNLANMSGQAAIEITSMLDKSIEEVDSIINKSKKRIEVLSEKGSQKIRQGVEKANECGIVLDEILENVQSVNNLMKEIEVATTEQATGVNEITNVMREFDILSKSTIQVSKENTEVSKEITALVENLSSISSELVNLVKVQANEVAKD